MMMLFVVYVKLFDHNEGAAVINLPREVRDAIRFKVVVNSSASRDSQQSYKASEEHDLEHAERNVKIADA
jgi:hypothetical protein